MLSIIAELLGLMVALALLGEPLRLVLSSASRSFRGLDFIEISILDVYLGGFVLYALALPPLHLFDVRIVGALLSVSTVILVMYYAFLSKRRRVQNDRSHKLQRKRILEHCLVFGMFIVALHVQVIPLTSLVYGSVPDTAYHSLLAEVIIENRNIPNTLAPYLPEGVIYPQAAHVIFAFAADLTGWVTPTAVLYVTPLFNALTILGVYFLARRLWQNRMFCLSAVFVSTFVATWPMFITWGANPFVIGLPLFLASSAILFTLLFEPGKKNKKELCLIGVLFGYLGTIVISFLQTLLTIAIIGLIAKFLLRHLDAKQKLRDLVFLFPISLLPLSPFLFRFIFYYPNVGHNIGLPTDFGGYPRVQNELGHGLQWAFGNLSPYPSLATGTLLIATASILLLFFAIKKERILKRTLSAIMLTLLASLSLSFLSEMLPPDIIGIASSVHQVIIMMVSLYLLVALFAPNLFASLRDAFSRFSKNNTSKHCVAFVVSALVLCLIYAPFISMRLSSDPSTLRGGYGVFAVTGNDDNRLMLWIRENVSQEATILVNQYEPGLFIPAVSNRKAIFATPGSQLSRRYQELCGLLSNGTLNATCINIMGSFGITHVYVGSVATYWWVKAYRWNPQLFLNSPNFRLIKRIGEAYLFQVSYDNL